jgi:hypothetical protein
MANEAVVLSLYGNPPGEPIRFTCTDTPGIEKGTLMKLSGSNICAASTAANGSPFAGIAATEKVSGDGQTTIGVWTKGKFDILTCGTAITAGDFVKLSGANLVGKALAADLLTGSIVGKALETVTTADTIAVQVGA